MLTDKTNILEMDLNEEQEQVLREELEKFKEEVYSNMLEEVEQLKKEKISELEEANKEWRSEVKKDYAERMLDALSEMREELKSEVTAELIESNPELHILESIKELVAPTLNESFVKNTYAQELVTLRKKLEQLEEERKLEEGARTLADLIRPYSKKTQNILISVINEGGPEEVTEQFYKILESIDELDEDEDDYDYEDIFEADSKDDEDDDEDEDDEVDEDIENLDTYIKEGRQESKSRKKSNPLLDRISQLAN